MMKDLPAIIKSPADRREYASFELDNGLRVVIIRDPEIQNEREGCHMDAREACQNASDSSRHSSEEDYSSDVCDIVIIMMMIRPNNPIESGVLRSNDL